MAPFTEWWRLAPKGARRDIAERQYGDAGEEAAERDFGRRRFANGRYRLKRSAGTRPAIPANPIGCVGAR